MKKLLAIILLVVLTSMAFATDMFFVEDYMEVDTTFYTGGIQKLNSVEFTTTTPISIVSITYGATYSGGCFWLVVDGDSIGVSTNADGSTFILELTEGMHTIDLMSNFTYNLRVRNPRLQVIVFLQDGSALSESPPDNNTPRVHSILTTGNMVHIEGCSEIYDISGQRIDCEINNGNIPLNTLSAGTYFAKGSTGRTTKIVKTY